MGSNHNEDEVESNENGDKDQLDMGSNYNKNEVESNENGDKDQLNMSSNYNEDEAESNANGDEDELVDMHFSDAAEKQLNDDDDESRPESNKDISKADCSAKPYEGKEFDDHMDAYNFYNRYATAKGFSIRISSTNKRRNSDIVIRRVFVCSKQGFKVQKSKGMAANQATTRGSTRVGCKAKLVIGLTNQGTWIVRKFDDEHPNHKLLFPVKVKNLRLPNRSHLTTMCTNPVEKFNETGTPPSEMAEPVNVTSGCPNESGALQNCCDHLRYIWKNNIGQECVAIISHFQERKHSDPDFYFAIELEKDRTFRSVFWADGRSRTSYLQYGDVLLFDVSYKMNTLSLPFAPFTGVNHHRQSTLFGCALLADETVETFVWLFKQWLKCMWNKAPLAIITDQDKAVRKAIKVVFPHTRHKFCLWHINEHVIEHIQPLQRVHGEEFSKDYEGWINSGSILEFEKQWEKFSKKYSLDKKNWLAKLYKQRHHCFHLYLKDTFFAGMTSTQQCESMNAYFDDYITSGTKLDEFVKQYDDAVAKRRAAEMDEDFRTINSKPTTISELDIEAQAGNCYTRNIFDRFQEEFKASLSCLIKNKTKEGQHATRYLVRFCKDPDNQCMTVVYNDEAYPDVKVTCYCAKFETDGILCKHILKIMQKKQLESIPERYILKRWTMDASCQIVGAAHRGLEDHVTTSENRTTPFMDWSLRFKVNKLLEETKSDIALYNQFDTMVSSMHVHVFNHRTLNKRLVNDALSRVGANVGLYNTLKPIAPKIMVCDPARVGIHNGRSTMTTRYQTGLEVALPQNHKKLKKM